MPNKDGSWTAAEQRLNEVIARHEKIHERFAELGVEIQGGLSFTPAQAEALLDRLERQEEALERESDRARTAAERLEP